MKGPCIVAVQGDGFSLASYRHRNPDDGTFTGGGLEVGFSLDQSPRLTDFLGRDVVLGVRPEHLTFSATAGKAPARVDLIESLGSSMDVYLTTSPGQRLVARVGASNACKPGQSVDLTVSAAHAHLFEPGAYGANLTSPSESSAP